MHTNHQIEHIHATERLLSELPLFGTLSRPAIRHLASAATSQAYPKGSVVVRQGDPCRGLYFILSGRCKSKTEQAGGGRLEKFLASREISQRAAGRTPVGLLDGQGRPRRSLSLRVGG